MSTMYTVRPEDADGLARSARCATCGLSWPASVECCPQDGTRLEVLEGARPLELDVGARLGDYVVTGLLGKGGMATVYAAIHPLIGKRVAIKVMAAELCSRREAVLRFVQEARSIGQLGHPNIVDIFTFGTLPDGRCYFVMDHLQGETLAQRMRDGALSFADKIRIGAEICDALEAVHAHGFVHRDLKPANVFLVGEERPRVKLLDFGIAKLVARGSDPGLTAGDMTLGTPEYVSPEQARGKELGPRSDIYALGVVLYELFAGRLPFIADNTADLLVMHVSEKPRPPSAAWGGMPTALEDLLLRMLNKNAAARPPLAQVRAGLEAVLAEVAARAEPPATRAEPRTRRFARAALVSLLALAPLLGFERAQPPPPPPPPEPVAAAVPPVAEVAPRAPPPPLPVEAIAPTPVEPATPAEKRRRGRPRARIDETFLVDPFAARAR